MKMTDGVHKYRLALSSTKGGRSRRVGLPPVVLESLRTLRSSLAEPPASESFIFTRGGTFIDPEYFTKWIAIPLIKKATKGGVKRFHDLRHFFTSMLIENGESPKYIQDQVGHASITTTFDTYGHLMPQAKRSATEKLERSIFGEGSVRTFVRHFRCRRDGKLRMLSNLAVKFCDWRGVVLQTIELLAPQVGLEPTTLRLTAGCSTIELLRSNGVSRTILRGRSAVSATT